MKKDLPKIKIIFLKSIKWLIVFLALIIFISLAESAFNQEILKMDIVGYQLVLKYFRSDTLTIIFKFITQLGSGVFLIFLAFSLLLLVKNKKIGLAIMANLWLVAFLNLLLKNILRRERPIAYRLINEEGFSFPSGHSMVSLAFYGFLIYLLYKYISNKHLRFSLIILLSFLILIIGFSRIYLGVHYTSDVIAGYLLGISYLIVYISVVKKFIIKR